MWRLLFLAVLVEVSCYATGDLFDDSDGLWLFGEDENTGVTSQRLTNVLENLDHRAFPEYELDANWDDDDEDGNVSGDDDDEDGNVSGDDDDEDGNVSGDDDDEDGNVSGDDDDEDGNVSGVPEGGATSASAENNVNVRDLADLVHDIERHLRLEPTPADLEIDDRGNDLGGSGGSKDDDTLDNGSTSAGDQAMEYRDENGGRLAPTVSVAARTKPVDGPVVSKRRRRTRPVSPYARIRQELQRITMLLFAQRAGLMNPRVKFGQPAMIPDYFYNYTITDEVYDEIDYNAARSQIEDTVRNAIQEESDPKEWVFVRLAPVLYKLRSGCTVNLLQRLVSAGLNRWTQTTALQIAKQRNFGLSVKYMIMSEINRTVFGNEFKKFEGVLDFMAQALAKNKTTSPAEFVFNMSSYILQCTPRSAFLENFIGRTRNLRSGLLNASPIAFTIRLLRAAPRPCTSLKPAQLFHSRLSMVKRVLRPIQKQLRSFLQAVYHALIHGRDDPIENIFPGYLEPNELALLRKVLGMLRAEGPASETISPAASPARRSYNRKREKETTYLQRLLKRLV